MQSTRCKPCLRLQTHKSKPGQPDAQSGTDPTTMVQRRAPVFQDTGAKGSPLAAAKCRWHGWKVCRTGAAQRQARAECWRRGCDTKVHQPASGVEVMGVMDSPLNLRNAGLPRLGWASCRSWPPRWAMCARHCGSRGCHCFATLRCPAHERFFGAHKQSQRSLSIVCVQTYRTRVLRFFVPLLRE